MAVRVNFGCHIYLHASAGIGDIVQGNNEQVFGLASAYTLTLRGQFDTKRNNEGSNSELRRYDRR